MLFLLKTLIAIDVLMATGLVLFYYALAPQYRSVVSGKMVVLALFTPVVALFCGNIFIFCGYLAVVVAFNSRSRSELAGIFVFLLPLMPMLSIETGVGGIYLLAISAGLAMGVGALVGFAVTSSRRSLAQTRYDVGVLLLIGIFIFIYSHDVSVTGLLRSLTTNVIGFAGPYLLISRGLGSREEIERLLLRLSAGATIVAVSAIFQGQKHWLLFETYYRTLKVPVAVTSWTLALRAGLLRTGGSMLDYSAAGIFLAAALTLMLVLRSRFRPQGFWAMMIVLGGGLLATQSRGAWVAAISGILFILAYRGSWGRVAILAGAGLIGETIILLFATSGRLAAIAGRTEEASGTVSYRRLLLSKGIEQVRAHPLLGQSPDQLVANLPELVQGQHIVDFVNAHLFIAMTAGVPLFLVWCYVWLAPVVEAWRHRSHRFNDGGLMEAPAAIIVPVMVAIVATSIMDRNLTWPTIALGIAGPCLAIGRQRRGARGREQMPSWGGIRVRAPVM